MTSWSWNGYTIDIRYNKCDLFLCFFFPFYLTDKQDSTVGFWRVLGGIPGNHQIVLRGFKEVLKTWDFQTITMWLCTALVQAIVLLLIVATLHVRHFWNLWKWCSICIWVWVCVCVFVLYVMLFLCGWGCLSWTVWIQLTLSFPPACDKLMFRVSLAITLFYTSVSQNQLCHLLSKRMKYSQKLNICLH